MRKPLPFEPGGIKAMSKPEIIGPSEFAQEMTRLIVEQNGQIIEQNAQILEVLSTPMVFIEPSTLDDFLKKK